MKSDFPYRDSNQPVEHRVADLLSRMTLPEKIAQLIGPFALEEEDGRFSLEFARRHFSDGIAYVNSHHRKRGARQTVEYLNAMQRFLKEETRLGIPALGVGEGLHGYMANEATSFPQAIGLASAWDPDLHERIFRIVAREMRVRGAHYVLSPVLDLGRDPRWGRTEETYGEDPYLVSRLGVAAVQGLQGRKFDGGPDHVLATAKHFAAHGQPESGTNCAPANYAELTLREEFLAPFQAVVQEAGIGSVMASYNEINGVPSHINTWLLQDVLRKEWGFQGFVVSDGWGVDDLYRLHFVAANETEAAMKAFNSGVELELGRCFRFLTDLVTTGQISESALDAAVGRILKVKFMLGLFENPFVSVEQAEIVTNCAEHRATALEAARKTIILLKNEGDLLPLDPNNLKSLAIIGPNAAPLRLGGYSGWPVQGISVLEGIRQKVGDRVNIRHAEGCGITQSTAGIEMWFEDEILPADDELDSARIAEAVALASQSDLTLLVLGDNEQTCREGWSVNHLGDRDSLNLPGRQEELLRSVIAVGKPVILLLLNGRPVSIPFAADHVPAILEGWYMGQEGGTAVADVLFGEANPGGKLPITIPRSVGQIPIYYYHKPSARRGYVFSTPTPLFPFGHGLSYTTFAYSDLRLDKACISPGESTILHVDVTNTGSRSGDEVVQLYIHDVISSKVTRPVMLLKGFERIHLKPGETNTVNFVIGPSQLAFLNENIKLVIEDGEFELKVGGSSASTHSISITVETR